MDILAILSWFGITDPTLQPAGITALFNVAGIVLTGLFATVAYLVSRGADRAARRALRDEKTHDLQLAIREEARAHWYELNAYGEFEPICAQVVADIQAGRWMTPTFTPFITRQAPSVVFDTIRADMALLDQDVIDIAINYYRQLQVIALLTEDLRSERFAQLLADRKVAMVEDYYRGLGALKSSTWQLNAVLEKALHLSRRRRDATMRQSS